MALTHRIDTDSNILIVGAAAGGLACAAALHQQGFTNVSLVEKAAEPAVLEHQAPINLGANAVRAYDLLGLQDLLLKHSWRWSGARIQNGNGRQLAYLDAEAIHQRAGYAPITTTRAQMLKVLRIGVPEAWLRYGTEVTTVAEMDQGLIVTFADGSTEQPALIIGADGFYSALRERVMGPTSMREDGMLSVQALIPKPDAGHVSQLATDGVFTEVVTTRGSVGFGRNSAHDFNIFFNVIEKDVKDPANGEALAHEVRATFAGLDPRVDSLLGLLEPERIRVYHPKDRPLSRGWSKGRIVLIGDAAHPCFQYTGLGAAMAIESGLVLAHYLKHKDTLSGAFQAYEAARLPRLKVVNSKSYQGARMFGLKNRLAAGIRDVVMGLTPARLASGPIANIHAEAFLP